MTGHPSSPVPGKAVFAGLVLAALAVAVAVYLGIGGFLHATSMSAQSEGEDAAERGREIAQANCAACHAIGAEGESPNPKSPPFRTLKDKYPVEDLGEALAEGIVTSHDNMEMPEFRFEADEVGDFIAYLKTL